MPAGVYTRTEYHKKRNSEGHKTHGLSDSPIYNVWSSMWSRCYDLKDPYYPSYGGREITICDRWHNVTNFYNDMYKSYKKGLSIDRVDNNKGYSPDNCRWATPKEQAENRRNTRLFIYKGIADTLTNWANYLGVNKKSLVSRIYLYNWNFEKAISTPIRSRKTLGAMGG